MRRMLQICSSEEPCTVYCMMPRVHKVVSIFLSDETHSVYLIMICCAKQAAFTFGRTVHTSTIKQIITKRCIFLYLILGFIIQRTSERFLIASAYTALHGFSCSVCITDG